MTSFCYAFGGVWAVDWTAVAVHLAVHYCYLKLNTATNAATAILNNRFWGLKGLKYGGQ